METYSVLKNITAELPEDVVLNPRDALRAGRANPLWEEVASEWQPESGYIQAQEVGKAFGEGTFLFIPAGYGRVQRETVVASKAFDFADVTEAA